ncbi:MAG TPA: flagellar basal body P-ring formation chaperone FlgA [Luteibacter sp.]|nr:flagellar basal body P-ring formation chaperone FlgA [Luteibacter sp.]
MKYAPPLFAAFAMLIAPAHAAQSLDSVRATAEAWLKANRTLPGARMVVHAEAMDSRLTLAPCSKPLVADLPGNRVIGSRVGVTVTCPDTGGWTLRVPVRIQMFGKVLVTSRPLARGDGIGADDVHTEERDIASLSYGYVAELGQVDGRALSRPLNAGTVLTPGMLAGRKAVRMGDSVAMIAHVDGVVVHAEGVSMGAGDAGSRLRVRNANSGKVVDAVVSGVGTVEVLPR